MVYKLYTRASISIPSVFITVHTPALTLARTQAHSHTNTHQYTMALHLNVAASAFC